MKILHLIGCFVPRYGGPSLLERARASIAHAIGRTVRVRGIDRLLRLLYNPDRRRSAYTHAVTRLRDGALFEVDTRSYLEWRLFLYGEYEPAVQSVIRACLRAGDTAIDVGANIGVHTVTMARAVGPSGLVVAVEPLPAVTGRLRRNLELNGLTSVVRVVPKAASSRLGRTSFYQPDQSASNQAQGSLLPLDYLDLHPVEIELVTLDALTDEYQLENVRLIKIDVEGKEPEVLEGAKELIRRQRPHLLFEYAPWQFGPQGAGWDDLLRLTETAFSYSLFEIGPRALRPLQGVRPSQSDMVLAKPRAGEGPR